MIATSFAAGQEGRRWLALKVDELFNVLILVEDSE